MSFNHKLNIKTPRSSSFYQKYDRETYRPLVSSGILRTNNLDFEDHFSDPKKISQLQYICNLTN